MNVSCYLALLKTIKIGKRLPDAIYFHVSCLVALDAELNQWIKHAALLAQLTESDYQVIKLSKSEAVLSLLAYSDFFENPFPALTANWRANLETENRLYFYGEDKPIHVSFSQMPKGEVVEMCVFATRRRIPNIFSVI